MARIQIKTSIDITDTGLKRPEPGRDKELNQFRNYTTFLQVLGIRSIFSIESSPVVKEGTWSFVIQTDREDVYLDGKDPIGLLKRDLDKIPIITGLGETKEIKQNLIRTSGPSTNTVVSLLQ